MKRAIGNVIAIIICAFAVLVGLIVILGVENAHQRAAIADLEQRNEALAKLCGVVMCVPCNKGETGPQCQARMGDAYEVIWYPRAEVFVAEVRPRAVLGGSEP